MNHNFQIGDPVYWSGYNKLGEVHKISEKGVHVKYRENHPIHKYSYQVFHFNPTHHMQTHINQLVRIES